MSGTLEAAVPAGSASTRFSMLLKSWRRKRRLSQLALALSSGVSQRHVSFLESGRAKPSRTMILQLSETLEVPLRDRNDWLAAAGFAPQFSALPLDDPRMEQIMAAVRMMLANHEPYPAVALDRAWNIRMANGAFDRLIAMAGSNVWTDIGGEQRNLMRLFFHPAGVRQLVTNWAAIAPLIWYRAQREADALGGEEMAQILRELETFYDAEAPWTEIEAGLVPVLPLEISVDGMSVSLFSVIATFGTAQDVTTDELRIESFFPANEASEQLLRATPAS